MMLRVNFPHTWLACLSRATACALFAVAFAVCVLLSPPKAEAAEPDWSDYATVLQRYTRTEEVGGATVTRVHYTGLRNEPQFGRVVEQLAAFSPDTLATRAERLAFYINAYNILAIKVVLDNWPLESIRDAGNLFRPVWKKTAGTIGGRAATLDEVEHRILRPLGEPRIHLAIVCASLSCPDLRREPYAAARLDMQLDEDARRFLRDPNKGVQVTADAIRVSRIFDWFGEDFAAGGGIETFIRRYRDDLPERPLRADLPYDWSLNGK
jgi:Protein of unknown function, DUF547